MWAKRTLLLDDGREAEVECGATVCYSEDDLCPALGAIRGRVCDCEYFGETLFDGYRPAACKRAEKRALDTTGGAGVE